LSTSSFPSPSSFFAEANRRTAAKLALSTDNSGNRAKELSRSHSELEETRHRAYQPTSRKGTSSYENKQKSCVSFPARLLQMQDEERRRIARELHDSVGQLVAAMGITLVPGGTRKQPH